MISPLKTGCRKTNIIFIVDREEICVELALNPDTGKVKRVNTAPWGGYHHLQHFLGP